MRTKRCNFWLPNKNRFCANCPLNGSLFCGNHNSRSEGQWIPCPIDPSHSVLEQNLKGHVKRCPLLKQTRSLSVQPFYQKGINAGSDGEEETSGVDDSSLPIKTVSSEMKRNALHGMSVPEFCKLIEKIEFIHESLCKDIQDSVQMPEVCSLWIKRGVEDRKLPFQEKHIMQQASIVGNLENFGLLKNSHGRKPSECGEPDEKKEEDVPAVIEFGAGRGYLTQMLADCYGIQQVFLVERKAYKLKADRSLRQNESLKLERLRIDIEDLELNAVESLQGVPFLAIGKHLCGAATDKRFFLDLGLTKEEFHAITWFTSWAVDANHDSDIPETTNCISHLQFIKEQGDGYVDGVEKILSDMQADRRAALGFKCKWIIDMGRLMWLREHGLDAKLVKFVPSSISPENHLLLARSSNLL
ncbi:tRNA:m(4)X modification enzyme TRM13 isoform X2 [Vigna angularis]|uniref:tRNA:m(4)X modification enzyme TRM13 isoform X2 n=1 Tax=Phaseolus angularis TaxID=3914 RepID=UPI0022B35699|nr:tRNA:m(4)X modification enzyme TRM13 isoform X2 [Vigna angularis]